MLVSPPVRRESAGHALRGTVDVTGAAIVVVAGEVAAGPRAADLPGCSADGAGGESTAAGATVGGVIDLRAM